MVIQEKDALYETYYPKVLGYLRSKLNSPEDAEDLTSEVFVKVYSKLDTFDSTKASVSTWIYTVTRNTLYDYFRTRHPGQELDETLPDDSDVDGSVCNDETLEELADALEKLPRKQRDLVVLHYYRGLTLKDAAQRLGISYSYAKLLHTEALARFKKSMSV